MVKTLAKTALPIVWSQLKKTKYAQAALQALKEYTGIDLNDDTGGFGNRFSFEPRNMRTLNWCDLSEDYRAGTRAYDGVSI